MQLHIHLSPAVWLKKKYKIFFFGFAYKVEKGYLSCKKVFFGNEYQKVEHSHRDYFKNYMFCRVKEIEKKSNLFNH